MTKKKLFLVLGVALVAVAAWLLLFKKSTKEELYTVRRGPAVEVVYATGTVEPVRMAVLTAETSGRLGELYADDGKAVLKDEILARLDDQEEQGGVAELEAKLKLNQIALARAEALFAKRAGSQQALDEAQSTLNQTQGQLAQAKERVRKRIFASPMNGTVLRRDGEVGEMINVGQQVFVVGDLSRLRVEMEVDEDDLPRIALSQKVLMTADAFPDQAVEGQLSEITPWGDTTNKSYRVRALLPSDTVLKAGMTVEANIVVREVPDALLVPVEAVKNGEVRVKGFGGASAQAVKTGIRGPDYIEVTEGLKEGDQIVAPKDGKAGPSLNSAANTVSNTVRTGAP